MYPTQREAGSEIRRVARGEEDAAVLLLPTIECSLLLILQEGSVRDR